MVERKRIYLCLAHMSESGLEQHYIKEAFDTNWVVPLGPNVNGFEKDLERFVNGSWSMVHGSNEGSLEPLTLNPEPCTLNPEPYTMNPEPTKRVVALSSGTAAVHLALIACGVKAGDEVIVQSFTFCASSHPITYLGATPVFVDSEKETWNMDPELLEVAIKDRIAKTGRKPKAIVPVALYGMPYRIDEIMAIANKYDIPVIEDAAEGFGSRFNGQVLGTFGRYGVLSFNGNKMITTSGGGALICNGEASPKSSPKGKDLGIHTADKMWYGLLKEFAEENRNKPTEAESMLWEALKGKGIGEKFRRQHIIDDFIVDFFCADKALTIEIDGGYHHYPPQMKSDAERTEALSRLGYIEMRFSNEEVLGDIDGVLQKILNFCNALPSKKSHPKASPQPSPEGKGALSHPSGGDLEGADEQWREIMMYATQYRESYPYYQHEKIGFNYRMSNICAGIGRGQMTIVDEHIAHHKHVQKLYEELLADVKGIKVHKQPKAYPQPFPEGKGALSHPSGGEIEGALSHPLGGDTEGALKSHPSGGEIEGAFDSNYWLCTITLDPDLKIKGQENAYKTVVQGAVGGAAGVIHVADSATTDCQPNDNVEALRVFMDAAGIEARPVWKPMHCQPVYKNAPAYVNGVSEAIFKVGMCLPAGPYVTDDDVKYIVETIKAAIA